MYYEERGLSLDGVQAFVPEIQSSRSGDGCGAKNEEEAESEDSQGIDPWTAHAVAPAVEEQSRSSVTVPQDGLPPTIRAPSSLSYFYRGLH